MKPATEDLPSVVEVTQMTGISFGHFMAALRFPDEQRADAETWFRLLPTQPRHALDDLHGLVDAITGFAFFDFPPDEAHAWFTLRVPPSEAEQMRTELGYTPASYVATAAFFGFNPLAVQTAMNLSYIGPEWATAGIPADRAWAYVDFPLPGGINEALPEWEPRAAAGEDVIGILGTLIALDDTREPFETLDVAQQRCAKVDD